MAKTQINSRFIQNPYLSSIDEDFLFHLNLGNKTHDLKAMFHDVKFVCMGGTGQRMRDFAIFLGKELGYGLSEESELEDIAAGGNRYSMYKVGCVLFVSHGMGFGSISILLHELIKLMHYSEVSNPIFIRTGTSGGVDIPKGTVVISTEVLNEFLEPYFEVAVLGKRVKRPAALDRHLAEQLKSVSEKLNVPVLCGTTVSTEHFYDSTAVKIAAICDKTDAERNEYYKKLKLYNVLNLDMEAVVLASMTHVTGIKAAIVNLVSDMAFVDQQDTTSGETVQEWQKRPQKIVAEYIKKEIQRFSNK